MRNAPSSFLLNNGTSIPQIGLGVYQTPADQTVAAVRAALDIGYRMIDTAAAYGNEREVGEAIRQSGIARDDVFIETKLWVSDYGRDATRHAFAKASGKLGVDRIDLFILHQPDAGNFGRTIEAYHALEQLQRDGAVSAIGVSNFTPDQLLRLLPEVDVVPAVNQIEVHPYFTQVASRAADAHHGILTQAWSPIGGISSYRGTSAATPTFDNPTLVAIGERHGRTPAQVMLRWHIQSGTQVIPKSTRRERIAENLAVFDFTLSPDDIAAIDALDTGQRGGPDPEQAQPAFHDLSIPEA